MTRKQTIIIAAYSTMIFTLVAALASALTIESPADTNYTGLVPVNLTANETQDSLSYVVNPGNLTDSCTNCTSLAESLNLTPGSYELAATSNIGNSTEQANVSFDVQSPPAFSFTITINQPQNITYNTTLVPLEIIANTSLDTMQYSLDNSSFVLACTSCAEYNSTLNLTQGDHTLSARGTKANSTNQSVERSVFFSVEFVHNSTSNQTENNTGNQSQGNKTHSGNFNYLVQALKSGTITDAQLAQIIQNNNLNPGLLNNLIKTGLLGHESITAIIQTQDAPGSIFNKLANFLGIHIKGPREQLLDYYNLTATQDADMLMDNDLSPRATDHLKQQLKDEQKHHGEDNDGHGVWGGQNNITNVTVNNTREGPHTFVGGFYNFTNNTNWTDNHSDKGGWNIHPNITQGDNWQDVGRGQLNNEPPQGNFGPNNQGHFNAGKQGDRHGSGKDD